MRKLFRSFSHYFQHHISVFREDKEKFSAITENYAELDRFIAFQMDSAHPDLTCDLGTGQCQVDQNSVFYETKKPKSMKRLARADSSLNNSLEMTVFLISALISTVLVIFYKVYYDKKSGHALN